MENDNGYSGVTMAHTQEQVMDAMKPQPAASKVVLPQYELRASVELVNKMTVDDMISLENGDTKGGRGFVAQMLYCPAKNRYYTEEEANAIIGKWTLQKLADVLTAVMEELKQSAVPNG